MQVYSLFRTLGLRHLCVVPKVSDCVGIITRKDLMPEVLEQHFPDEALGPSVTLEEGQWLINPITTLLPRQSTANTPQESRAKPQTSFLPLLILNEEPSVYDILTSNEGDFYHAKLSQGIREKLKAESRNGISDISFQRRLLPPAECDGDVSLEVELASLKTLFESCSLHKHLYVSCESKWPRISFAAQGFVSRQGYGSRHAFSAPLPRQTSM